jgi:hypothetical protein
MSDDTEIIRNVKIYSERLLIILKLIKTNNLTDDNAIDEKIQETKIKIRGLLDC